MSWDGREDFRKFDVGHDGRQWKDGGQLEQIGIQFENSQRFIPTLCVNTRTTAVFSAGKVVGQGERRLDFDPSMQQHDCQRAMEAKPLSLTVIWVIIAW
jgi:hypothetical protein